MKCCVKNVVFVLLMCVVCVICAPFAMASVQNILRPEYPDPQMRRAEWMNLNGKWEFAETDDSSKQYLGDTPYPDTIIVPFCRESKLSGLGRLGFVKNVWYRRSFELDKSWKSPRTRLHIGACDWATSVWINGELAGTHKGGSAPIVLDITNYLQPGKNTVIIHAFDDTRSGLQETGKQAHSEKSEGCVYTRVTGIWQTVWLEGVGLSYIKDFKVDCEPSSSRVFIKPNIDVSQNKLTLKAVAYAGDKVVGSSQVPVDWRNTSLELKLSNKHLWSINDPFLYGLKLTLLDGKKVVDELQSYFGLRTVSIKGAAILINGKPVFQRLVLDQGYYPDGIWTAPSEEALKHDIEISQAAGFNGARLHQKVFEPRYLYWADKLGYIVWGESPNWGMDAGNSLTHLPFIDEWMEVLKRDRNHPAIIGWCPFNETPSNACPLQNATVNLTRLIDPSRPVFDVSGWSHGITDPEVLDMHDYDQNPDTFRNKWNDSYLATMFLPKRYGGTEESSVYPFMISEFGGTQWSKVGSGWGYGSAPQNVEEFYNRFSGLTSALLDSRYIFGFCYTQLYDVEQERNGLYTYQREPKFDVRRLHNILSKKAACEKNPAFNIAMPKIKWNLSVGAVQDGAAAHEWKYTFDKPSDSWIKPDYDDSGWLKGFGGFGSNVDPSIIKTTWNTKGIWLRQNFNNDNLEFNKVLLVLNHDDDCSVYINGTKVFSQTRWTTRYCAYDITDAAKSAIKVGNNIIAIECEQNYGGQFIDAALLVGSAEK